MVCLRNQYSLVKPVPVGGKVGISRLEFLLELVMQPIVAAEDQQHRSGGLDEPTKGRGKAGIRVVCRGWG